MLTCLYKHISTVILGHVVAVLVISQGHIKLPPLLLLITYERLLCNSMEPRLLLYKSATEAFISLFCAKQAQKIATFSNTTGSTARANHGENIDSLLCSKHRDLKKELLQCH